MESAQAKNQALRDAGAHVPDSFEGLEAAVKKLHDSMVAKGTLVPAPDKPVPPMPMDLSAAVAQGLVSCVCGCVCVCVGVGVVGGN